MAAAAGEGGDAGRGIYDDEVEAEMKTLKEQTMVEVGRLDTKPWIKEILDLEVEKLVWDQGNQWGQPRDVDEAEVKLMEQSVTLHPPTDLVPVTVWTMTAAGMAPFTPLRD